MRKGANIGVISDIASGAEVVAVEDEFECKFDVTGIAPQLPSKSQHHRCDLTLTPTPTLNATRSLSSYSKYSDRLSAKPRFSNNCLYAVYMPNDLEYVLTH